MENQKLADNDLDNDRDDLTQRTIDLSDRTENELSLLWHLQNPDENKKVKELLGEERIVNNMSLILTAIATGNEAHLEHLACVPKKTAMRIVRKIRDEIEAIGVPMAELPATRFVHLLNGIQSKILEEIEGTFFGEDS